MKLKTGEKVHDYTNMFWGWSLLYINHTDDKPYVMGIGKGIKEGEFLMFIHNKTNEKRGYQLGKVRYESNPNDMFKAEIKNQVLFEEGDFTQTSNDK